MTDGTTRKLRAGLKIDATAAAAIRADRRVYEEIARHYGISTALVSMIKTGKRWRRVADTPSNVRAMGGIGWGGGHHRAKLTPEAVRRIRADTRTLEAIAGDYGVSHTTIREVKLRLAWKWVT